MGAVLGAVLLTAGPARSEPKNLPELLKNAVVEAQAKLGELEPWQKKIFDEEVVPQHQRFIRDYRPTANGVLIDVDHETLKKYLAFYAPKALKREDAKILVYLRADESCTKCTESTDAVGRLARARLERRGFTPVILTADDVGNVTALGKTLRERLTDLAAQRNVAGALLIESSMAAGDDAHADEKHYLVQYYLLGREGKAAGAQLPKEYRHDGKLELMENDNVETAVARLMTDSFTDFGYKTILAKLYGEDTEEIWLVVNGVQGFAHYQKIRTQLQDALKDSSSFEDRKIMRGQVIFGVRGGKNPQELKTLINSLTLDNQKFNVVSMEGTSLQLEIK